MQSRSVAVVRVAALVLELQTGGDLGFHLKKQKRFSVNVARPTSPRPEKLRSPLGDSPPHVQRRFVR